MAGHVIECGAQATGGNFSGFRAIRDLAHPGFPLAEIDQDGTSVITKHEGTGGSVSVDTVTAQLLYEIGGPEYLNPDVVARLDTVTLEQMRTGSRRHPEYWETAHSYDQGRDHGPRSVAQQRSVVLTGLEIDAKAALVERRCGLGLEGEPGFGDLRFTRIGAARDDPLNRWPARACCRSRSTVRSRPAEEPSRPSWSSSLSSNFPGIYYTEPPRQRLSVGAYWPALVEQSPGACRGRCRR